MTELQGFEETYEYPQGDVAPIDHWHLDDFADILVPEGD